MSLIKQHHCGALRESYGFLKTQLLLSLIFLFIPTVAHSQQPLSNDERAMAVHMALQAHDRFLETWNTRDPATWAASLNYPHVRPSPTPRFDLFLTPEAYAANTDFSRTLATGWRYTRWHSREVLQVSRDKVHIAGRWIRYDENDNPIRSALVTYVITYRDGHWGLQSRFGAGRYTDNRNIENVSAANAKEAVENYYSALNSHDPLRLADAIHIPHVRIAGVDVEYWETQEDFIDGTEPGRQRTWLETRIKNLQVVQATANSANVTLRYARIGVDGGELSEYEALLLVTQRDGEWKVQARSMMGP